MKLLDLQAQTPHSERIIKNGCFVKPTFYGDYFSKELVPLNGMVGALRHFTGGATNEKGYHNRTRVRKRRT